MTILNQHINNSTISYARIAQICKQHMCNFSTVQVSAHVHCVKTGDIDLAHLAICVKPAHFFSCVVTRQYQFQCIDYEQNGQPVWATIVAGSNLFIQTLNPTANLSTPLADQCRRCIDDQQSNRSDSTTHCDHESSIDHTLSLLIMFIHAHSVSSTM